MRKNKILFLCIISLATLICGCNMTKKEQDNKQSGELTKWKSLYAIQLKELREKNTDMNYEFVIKDIDNDSIPELIVNEELKLTVYKCDTEVEKIGSHDFATATTRFFSSDKYSGIFYFYVDGGLNHYGYIDIQEKELKVEELWNEDYSGISEEIGENREQIVKFSNDKKLIEESKELYNNNCDLEFIENTEDNLNNLNDIMKEYETNN